MWKCLDQNVNKITGKKYQNYDRVDWGINVALYLWSFVQKEDLTRRLIQLYILRSICSFHLSQSAISTVWKLDEWCTIIFLIWNYSYASIVTFCKSHYNPWRSNLVLNRHVLVNFCLRSSLHLGHKKKPNFGGGNEKGREQQRGKQEE